MAGHKPARGGVGESMAAFVQRRRREVESFGREAETAAHNAYREAIRVGQNLRLSQPVDLMAYGAGLLQRQSAQHSTSVTQPAKSPVRPRTWVGVEPALQAPSPTVGKTIREVALQADTAVRGAANVLTLGGADNLEAAVNALLEPGGVRDWRRRYEINKVEESARNMYDASHRKAAQATGYVGGTLLGLGFVGPMEGALAAVPRLPGAAALTRNEAAAILGAGGVSGLGVQTLSDVAAGGRHSSFGDTAGAVIGGVAGAAALPLGPARAGATGATATSVAQDLLNGRPISMQRAGENAVAGNLLGGVMGGGGRAWSNGLSRRAKGRLGEALGEIRSTLNGQRREWRPKFRDEILEEAGGGYWYPDGISGAQRFEDKFEVTADLTPNQIRAQSALGARFTLNRFLPADVGKAMGLPAGLAAAPMIEDRQPQRYDR